MIDTLASAAVWLCVALIILQAIRARPQSSPMMEVEWVDDEEDEDEDDDLELDEVTLEREKEAALNIAAKHLTALTRIALAQDATADQLRAMANEATEDFAIEVRNGAFRKVHGLQ